MIEDPSEWVRTAEGYDIEKHKSERAEQGFSVFDWWNFCDYIAWVNIQALERFKAGHGYPADLGNMDEWRDELATMIIGFKAHLTLNNLEYDWKSKEKTKALTDDYERGMALYAKRFSALWD